MLTPRGGCAAPPRLRRSIDEWLCEVDEAGFLERDHEVSTQFAVAARERRVGRLRQVRERHAQLGRPGDRVGGQDSERSQERGAAPTKWRRNPSSAAPRRWATAEVRMMGRLQPAQKLDRWQHIGGAGGMPEEHGFDKRGRGRRRRPAEVEARGLRDSAASHPMLASGGVPGRPSGAGLGEPRRGNLVEERGGFAEEDCDRTHRGSRGQGHRQ